MELDWTTFLLEIVNFIVLVWILKRFLYRPVLDAIARRRAYIEQTMADGKKIQDEAVALKLELENRVAEWDKKRETMLDKLTEEISARREKMLADLDAAADLEKEKKRAIEAQHQRESQREAEEKALSQASQFAATLLARLASPELDARLFDILLQDLRKFAPKDVASMIAGANHADMHVNVVSAFPLSPERRAELLKAINNLVGREIPATFSENRDLLSGLHVSVGPWILHANLRDELAYFRESANGES